MKKEDSKAKVYGQNEKIWYLCIPYYFLSSPTMSLLETKMGDKGLLIYMRLLFLATASQGILRLDNAEQETFFGQFLDENTPRSPISSIVSALGDRYTEQDVMKTLHILEHCGAIKVLAEEQLRFRDVYEMGVERQRRAAEKRAQKGRIMFEEGLEEPEELIEEQPEETEEETEEERKKRDKKEAKQKKREEDLARFLEAWKQADMPKYLKLNPDRKKSLMARIDEFGLDNMLKAIEIASDSKFLRGMGPTEDGKEPFIAKIDFFCRANKVTKILEGDYDFAGKLSDTEQKPVQPPKPVTEEDVLAKLKALGVETPSGFDWDRWRIYKTSFTDEEIPFAEARGRKLTGKTA